MRCGAAGRLSNAMSMLCVRAMKTILFVMSRMCVCVCAQASMRWVIVAKGWPGVRHEDACVFARIKRCGQCKAFTLIALLKPKPN